MQTYIRVVSAVSRAFGIFSMLLLAAAVLVVSQMIFVRYVLNGSTIWQTEFVIYAVIAATHGRGRLVLQIIAGVASLAFCAVLAWSGWVYFHEALTRGWKTATVWALPLWIPLLPMPVGIGLLCLQYVAELMKLANPRCWARCSACWRPGCRSPSRSASSRSARWS